MSGMPDSSEGGSFDSLEEYIKATSRDHDEEVRKAMRLWHWQDTEILVIAVDINTNAAEIVNRAYSIGLQKLRDDIGDDIEEVNQMTAQFVRAVGSIYSDTTGGNELRQEIIEYEIDFAGDFGELTDPRKFPIRKSELSEVKDRYMYKGPFGGWLHRVVVMLGLKESENVTEEIQGVINSVEASLSNSVDDSREYLEERMKILVSRNIDTWLMEGVDDDTLDMLYETAEYMDTKHKDGMKALLDAVNTNQGG